jgi:hypothetical protein
MHVTMAVHCVATALLFCQTELPKPEVGPLEPHSRERLNLEQPGFFLSDPLHVGHWVVCRIGFSDGSEAAALPAGKNKPNDESNDIAVEWPGLLAVDLNTGRALRLMAPRSATPKVTNWVDGNLPLGPNRCGALVMRFERDGKKMGKVLDATLWEWNLEQNNVVSAGPWDSARMVATLLDPTTTEVAPSKTDASKADAAKTSARRIGPGKNSAAKTGPAKTSARKSGAPKSDAAKKSASKGDAAKDDADKEDRSDSETLEIRDKQSGRATQCVFDAEPVLLEPPSPEVADGAPTLIPCTDRRSFVVLNPIPSSEVMKFWRLECVDPRAPDGRRWRISPADVQKMTGFAPTSVFPVPGTAADFDHFVVQVGSADEKKQEDRSHLLTIDGRTGQITKAVRLPENPPSQEVDSLFASLHGSLAVFRCGEIRKPEQPEAPIKLTLFVFDVSKGSVRARFNFSKLEDVIPFGFDEKGRILGFSDEKAEIWRFTVDQMLHAERLFQLHPAAALKQPAPGPRRSSTKRVSAP